jgi:hypothetical protein
MASWKHPSVERRGRTTSRVLRAAGAAFGVVASIAGTTSRTLAVTASLALLVPAAALAAPEVDRTKAATVKAAYLLNFLRYTEWPEGAFETSDAPIVVTQVGDCEVGDVLPEVIERADPIAGHPLSLQRVVAPDAAPDRAAFLRSIEDSHLVFVCPCTDEGVEAIVAHLRGKNVLTVGDSAEFADSGGMIGFVLQRDRIVFEANPQAIQDSAVSISAKVLKLASIVGGGR